MSAGFSKPQLKKLATELDSRRIQRRQQDGRTLSYIEGWFALAEANRIFGYDGWDREMVHCERVFERKGRDTIECGYLARVRVRVRAQSTIVIREGTGFGQASAAAPGEAHERALKAAETDATKRALVTFGSRFGLLLYNKERRLDAVPKRLSTPDVSSLQLLSSRATSEAVKSSSSRPASSEAAVSDSVRATCPRDLQSSYQLIASDGSTIEVLTPEAFCTALRQLFVAARSPDELARLRWNNEPTLSRLRGLPQLVTAQGRHYADILEKLIAKHLEQFAHQSQQPNKEDCRESKIAEAPNASGPVAVSASPRELVRPFVPAPPYPLAKLGEIFAHKTPIVEVPSVTVSTDVPPTDVSASSEIHQTHDAALPTRRSQITTGFAIDKSALAFPSERRLRSKAHRMFVASRPCIICSAQPCHAHHLTFAQRRGLSQKVSDEFVVPLCVSHHNELHAAHNEASWWRSHGIEPLGAAKVLWCQTMGKQLSEVPY